MRSDEVPEWAMHLPAMAIEPTGRILARKFTPPGQEWPVLTVTELAWEGGDLVAISWEMLDAAEPDIVHREGNVIAIGRFRLEPIGYDPRGWVLARRVRDQVDTGRTAV